MSEERFQSLDPCTLLSPVPVVMVSCGRAGETPNIITLAWAGTVCSHPPMVALGIRPERYSHDIIKQSGEAVLNMTDVETARATDFCGVRSGRDVDKFAALGLTAMPAPGLETAPAIAQCPAHLSLKVETILPLGSHDLFLCRIVAVRVQKRLFRKDGSLALDRAELLCYSHGVYQRAVDVLGFFGFSVAGEDVYQTRMDTLKRPLDA